MKTKDKMIYAYIFIETEQGTAKATTDRVRSIKGVVSCHSVTGPYDVIALVEAENIPILGEFIVAQIQHIPGVIRTLTNVVCS